MDNIKKGTLSKEQIDEAIAWVNKHSMTWDKKCEFCAGGGWTVSPDLVAPVVFTGGYVLGGDAYPQFMMMCNNCGNTKYFNAVVAKIIPSKVGGGKDGK